MNKFLCLANYIYVFVFVFIVSVRLGSSAFLHASTHSISKTTKFIGTDMRD